MKKVLKLISELSVTMLLCSFSNNEYTYSDSIGTSVNSYTDSNGKTREIDESPFEDKIKSNDDDISVSFSGFVGRFLRVKIRSITEYNAANNGYILSYQRPMKNPKAITSDTITLTATYSEEYTYSFSKEISTEFSSAIMHSLNFANILKFEQTSQVSHSQTTIESYSHSYGQMNTFQESLQINLEAVENGYIYSLGLVCSARVLHLEWSVYDNFWWGNYLTAYEDQKFQNVDLLVYDKDSIF